jgi:hypothetical protein
MRKMTILASILIGCGLAIAQPNPTSLWSRLIVSDGLDYATDVCATLDGGFASVALANVSELGDNVDGLLVKLNGAGDTLWTRRWAGTPYFEIGAIEETPDHGFIIAGMVQVHSDSMPNAFLLKTDSLGNTQWMRTYGGDQFERFVSILVLPEGGFIAAGTTTSFGAGGNDAYVVRTSSLGDTLWTAAYGTPDDEWANDIEIADEGGYILGGATSINADDMYLLKIDADGVYTWSHTYYAQGYDEAVAVHGTSDGGYILFGHSDSFDPNQYYDYFLIQTDRSGDTLWTRNFGTNGYNIAADMLAEPDGGFILLGTNSWSTADMMLYKLDAFGATVWLRRYFQNSYYEQGFSICRTNDGGFVLAGTQSPVAPEPQWDIFLTRTGSAITPAEDRDPQLAPGDYSLFAYPNPFNPTTTLAFSLPSPALVTITVYDILGREALSLARNELFSAGKHQLTFDAPELPSGVYIARLTSGNVNVVKKLLLLK